MRDPHQNSILTLGRLIRDVGYKTQESLVSLFSGKRGSEGGILWSLIHHIMITGPLAWRERPTGVSMGRAIFTPLVFIFSQVRSPGNTQVK